MDAAYSALCAAPVAGALVPFLTALRESFAAMPDTPTGIRADVLVRIDADLSRDGVPLPAPVPRLDLHPLAADYVMLGSRSGAAYLRRAWADVPGVANSAFFAADADRAAWRDLTDRLAGQPATGPAADRIVADARTAFAAFGHAAARLRSRSAA